MNKLPLRAAESFVLNEEAPFSPGRAHMNFLGVSSSGRIFFDRVGGTRDEKSSLAARGNGCF